MRRLTFDDIEIEVFCEPEDMSIDGNASAIDDDTDAQIAAHIREQLNMGNQWAWCQEVPMPSC